MDYFLWRKANEVGVDMGFIKRPRCNFWPQEFDTEEACLYARKQMESVEKWRPDTSYFLLSVPKE